MNTIQTSPLRERLSVFHPLEIIDIKCSSEEMLLFISVKPSNALAYSLTCKILTLRVFSPSPNMIAIQAWHNRGQHKHHTTFNLNHRHVSPMITETENEHILLSGNMEARVSKSGEIGVTFLYNNKVLTHTGLNDLALIVDAEGNSYIRDRLSLDVNENIYGLGEHSMPLVRNGQSINIWNAASDLYSDASNKCIPFFLSSKNYGVFANHTTQVSFDIAHASSSKAQITVPGQMLEYRIIAGDSLKHVLSLFSDLIGKPALPPAWSFGLSMSASALAEYNDEWVLEYVDGMLERGIPISIFHFGGLWMKDFEWTGFLWDEERFPDPAGLIRSLHERGVRVCLWINPFVSQKSKLFSEGLDGNYFIHTSDGNLYQTDTFQPGAAMIDFSNLVAKAWFQKYLDEMIKMGVDTFMTDWSEYAPVAHRSSEICDHTQPILFKNNLSPESMHNTYTYLFNEAVFEWLEKRFGKNNTFLYACAATIGSQRFPVQHTGKANSTYQGMAQTLRGGLSMSLSGLCFWSQDIGGYFDGCDPDLYMRWFQFGMLTSHALLHGHKQYKVPWMYGEEAVEIADQFTRLKLGMMPYLFSLAVEASTVGLPITRPMMLEFPTDETCGHLDRQFMLGPSLLCAPIFSSDGSVHYYVPRGIWTNILTQDRIEGPCWRKEKHDYFTLPILARENTILVTGKTDDTPEYDYLDSVTITIFELKENKQANFDVFSADAKRSGVIRAMRKEGRIYVETEGIKGQCRLVLTNIFETKSVSTGTAETNEWGTLIVFPAGHIEIELG